jgi:hypothetical protein
LQQINLINIILYLKQLNKLRTGIKWNELETGKNSLLTNYLDVTARILYRRYVFLLILFLFLCLNEYNDSQFIMGHFFGTTKNIGDYKIVFAPYPALPLAGDNSTLLNFSILDKDNNNINNIVASIIVKNKLNGSIVQNIPFKFYEFSDITFPYTFKEVGDYQVSLLVKINGDPTYSQTPISVDFDISATNQNQVIPTDELITYYLVPGLAAIAAIEAYLRHKNKI